MEDKISVLISEDRLIARTKEVAAQINEDYAGNELLIICTLKGAVFFTCELSKYLTMPVKFAFIKCSSYGSGTVSSGKIRMDLDIGEDIKGRHCLIVEDIIDSGNTLSHLKALLGTREPASLKIATLLDKPSRRVVKELVPDYNGFTIDDLFVVGYGLDYDQKYRNLPYIGVMETAE